MVVLGGRPAAAYAHRSEQQPRQREAGAVGDDSPRRVAQHQQDPAAGRADHDDQVLHDAEQRVRRRQILLVHHLGHQRPGRREVYGADCCGRRRQREDEQHRPVAKHHTGQCRHEDQRDPGRDAQKPNPLVPVGHDTGERREEHAGHPAGRRRRRDPRGRAGAVEDVDDEHHVVRPAALRSAVRCSPARRRGSPSLTRIWRAPRPTASCPRLTQRQSAMTATAARSADVASPMSRVACRRSAPAPKSSARPRARSASVRP